MKSNYYAIGSEVYKRGLVVFSIGFATEGKEREWATKLATLLNKENTENPPPQTGKQLVPVTSTSSDPHVEEDNEPPFIRDPKPSGSHEDYKDYLL